MTKKQKKTLKRIIISAVLYLAIILASKLVAIPWYLELVLFLVPYFIIGHDVLRKAVLGIVHGEVFDETFLLAVATVGALCLGEFSESVAVMLFYQIGELFQSYAVGKSRKSISDLMDIRPDSANLETADGTVSTVDPDDVPIGSVLVVRPGEKVPIDGEVISGESTLNTAALTGEIEKSQFVTDPTFGVQVPTSIEGVPSELLIPENTWEDKAAYQASCKKLAASFVENFKKYTHMSDEVVAAGPKA